MTMHNRHTVCAKKDGEIAGHVPRKVLWMAWSVLQGNSLVLPFASSTPELRRQFEGGY